MKKQNKDNTRILIEEDWDLEGSSWEKLREEETGDGY